MVPGWSLRAVSFGFEYFPSKEQLRIGLELFPLRALLNSLREHGYAYRYDEGESWKEGLPALKRCLVDGTPVLVICHMGWLAYNKEYEMFRTMGGVVDHYVVVTGFRDDEVVSVNDPNPDAFRKSAELLVKDFRVAWGPKLREIQGMSCPMLTVTARKREPDQKGIRAAPRVAGDPCVIITDYHIVLRG